MIAFSGGCSLEVPSLAWLAGRILYTYVVPRILRFRVGYTGAFCLVIWLFAGLIRGA
jgi:hypothetical protein